MTNFNIVLTAFIFSSLAHVLPLYILFTAIAVGEFPVALVLAPALAFTYFITTKTAIANAE